MGVEGEYPLAEKKLPESRGGTAKPIKIFAWSLDHP
jgi:hypothetical protein